MINIVIPMAGCGSRFLKVGYQKPKPFIDVKGKTMIVRVLENLCYEDSRYILLARKEHMDIELKIIREIEKEFNAIFIPIDKLTEGAACTVLFARKYINNDEPLLLVNSDQIVDISIKEYIEDCFERNLDGSILTFEDPEKSTKWSFARVDENGLLTEVQEKKPISQHATVGIYLFSRGRDFVDAALDMIVANDRVNSEFYVCPVYNYMLQSEKKIGIYNIDFQAMHGLGTPEDLNTYIKHLEISGVS